MAQSTRPTRTSARPGPHCEGAVKITPATFRSAGPALPTCGPVRVRLVLLRASLPLRLAPAPVRHANNLIWLRDSDNFEAARNPSMLPSLTGPHSEVALQDYFHPNRSLPGGLRLLTDGRMC